MTEHNESIFRAEWKDDWKLVKNEDGSFKRGGAPISLSLDDPLKIFGAAVFAFIRDLLNIHPLWCMYMLQLINDALGAYPNLRNYQSSDRAGTKTDAPNASIRG